LASSPHDRRMLIGGCWISVDRTSPTSAAWRVRWWCPRRRGGTVMPSATTGRWVQKVRAAEHIC